MGFQEKGTTVSCFYVEKRVVKDFKIKFRLKAVSMCKRGDSKGFKKMYGQMRFSYGKEGDKSVFLIE